MRTLKLLLLLFTMHIVNSPSAIANTIPTGQDDRQYWVETMLKIVTPVFENLSNNTLRKNMPVETNEGYNTGKRADLTHLEALGRAFCGIAPWLNLPADNTKEGKSREQLTRIVVKAIQNAVDPSSPDYLPFDGPASQPLVDAAFLAQGLLRSKDQIWTRLDKQTQTRLIDEMKRSRKIKPYQNNWLLFSAMIEAALLHFTGECEMAPIEYAINKHKEWYKGDGWYGDGPNFHLDYYNSFVIQPMLTDVLEVLRSKGLDKDNFYDVQKKRLIRYAVQQEMFISPEGTYPIVGRSMAYRFGAFQVLSQVALRKELPASILPAQVRCALTTVIKRQLLPETFDKDGWLTLGACGHQPEMAENYVSTGSAYLCSLVFLPLGLPAEDAFWSSPAAAWSSQKMWKGEPMKRDASIRN